MAWLIQQLAAAPRALLIHGNDLNQKEIELLSEHANVTVVYCPRTHGFFQYDVHPVNRLTASGVRVALGTDSRASNPDLNLWKEVQYLLNRRPDIRPQDVLQMATLHGADALGRHDLGRLEVNRLARFAAIATNASTVEQVYEACAHEDLQRLPNIA